MGRRQADNLSDATHAFAQPFATSGHNAGGTRLLGPRPPSRSMVHAPIFQILSPSRPGTTVVPSNCRDRHREPQAVVPILPRLGFVHTNPRSNADARPGSAVLRQQQRQERKQQRK